jgi:Retroviral aspartyl protease
MRFDGFWALGTDRILRPVLKGFVLDADGDLEDVIFMLDTGADRTVFAAETLKVLGKAWPELNNFQLEGVGGSTSVVSVDEVICFLNESTEPIPFRGPFLGFTDPNALEISILGRDLLNHFAVIVDRQADRVALLTKQTQYTIKGL